MGCMAHCGHCDHAITPRPDACSPPLPTRCQESRTTPGEIANLTSRSDSLPFDHWRSYWTDPSVSFGFHCCTPYTLTHTHTRPSLRIGLDTCTPTHTRTHPDTPTSTHTPPHPFFPLALLLLLACVWLWGFLLHRCCGYCTHTSYSLAPCPGPGPGPGPSSLSLSFSFLCSHPHPPGSSAAAQLIARTHTQSLTCAPRSRSTNPLLPSFFPSLDPSTAIFVSTHPTSSLCPISPYFTSPFPLHQPLVFPVHSVLSSHVKSSPVIFLASQSTQSIARRNINSFDQRPSDSPVIKEYCDVGPIRQVISVTRSATSSHTRPRTADLDDHRPDLDLSRSHLHAGSVLPATTACASAQKTSDQRCSACSALHHTTNTRRYIGHLASSNSVTQTAACESVSVIRTP